MPPRLSHAPPERPFPPPLRCHKTVGTLCSGCVRGGRFRRRDAGLPQGEGSMTMLRQAAPKRLGLRFASQGGFVEPWLKPLQRGGVVGFIPGLKARVALAEARGGLDPVLGRLGSLEVRLATTPKDIRRAQRLRYKVFYEEMSAVPNGASLFSRRDLDDYDAICDHLLVLDHGARRKPFRKPKPQVVGTYRLLRQEVADRHFGFYTAGEYDVAPLVEAYPGLRFLELGRSCVLPAYRNRR